MTHRIAILGDFNPDYSTHHALNESIRQMRKLFSAEIQFDWISTDIFNSKTAFENLYGGLWIAPGSPYKNMQNVLDTITYTRENDVPTLGNCGGFQHLLIEFARNVCGLENADHEETNPDANDLIISKLSCSLVQQTEELTIIDTDSILFNALKKDRLIGRYFCSYGLNDKYVELFRTNGISFTSKSADGQWRSFEIKTHPFFVGTLFQPALTSTLAEPNPIIVEFIKRSISRD